MGNDVGDDDVSMPMLTTVSVMLPVARMNQITMMTRAKERDGKRCPRSCRSCCCWFGMTSWARFVLLMLFRAVDKNMVAMFSVPNHAEDDAGDDANYRDSSGHSDDN